MDNNVIIAIVSLLIFIIGGVVLNYQAKRDQKKAEEQRAQTSASASEMKKAA